MTTAVILAGGLGTRLRDVVSDVPKPMAPVGGRPFLEHQLDFWIAAGVDKFILSVGYRREVIISHFGASYRGAAIAYAIEEEPLGTGGAVLLAMAGLDRNTSFLLLNGDTYFEIDAEALIRLHREQHADLTVALFRALEADRYGGLAVDDEGRITVLRSGKAKIGDLANGGVYVVEPNMLLNRFGPGRKISFEDDILPAAFEGGAKLFGMECVGRFIDIGVPDDYFNAANVISRGNHMLEVGKVLRKNLDASIAAKQQMLTQGGQIEMFARATNEVVSCYRQGGRLYVAGNGGSAADAQHLAAEFVSKLAHDRAPLPAEALTVDSSILTAIGNDYGYDQLFSRQIEGKMRAGDIFLGITTSGQSKNILNALETCRARGIRSIVFSGKDGGKAKDLADYCIVAPGRTTGTIQEVHIVLAHSLCECVESVLIGED